MCSNDSSCLGNVTGCNSRPAFSTAMRTAATTNSVASSFGPMTMGWRPFSGDRCISEICCVSEDDCLFGMGYPTIWLFGLEHEYDIGLDTKLLWVRGGIILGLYCWLERVLVLYVQWVLSTLFGSMKYGVLWYLLRGNLMLICDISTHCDFTMLLKLKLIQRREFIAIFVIFREKYSFTCLNFIGFKGRIIVYFLYSVLYMLLIAC